MRVETGIARANGAREKSFSQSLLEFESRAWSIAVESAAETVAQTDFEILTGMW